jgi:hypothetical protein
MAVARRRLLILLAIFAMLGLEGGCPWPVLAQGGTNGWSSSLNISNTPGVSRFVRVAADPAGNLHVVWSENVDTAPGAWGNAIYYVQQVDGRWSQPIDIVFQGQGTAHLPDIAADSRGYLHLVWTDNVHLYHMRAQWDQAVSANTWSRPKMISLPQAESVYWSDVLVDGDTIHVAWSGAPQGELWDIYYTRSTDGGETWAKPVNVTEMPDVMETRPRLAVSQEGVVYLAWGQNQADDYVLGPIMFSWSNNGREWMNPQVGSPFDGWTDIAMFTLDQVGRLHQTWQQGVSGVMFVLDDVNQGLYHRWSGDGGQTWSEPTKIAHGWSYLDVAVDSASQLHLVWQEQLPGESKDVCYASWNGLTWSTPLPIARNQGDARPQVVVTEGNKVHVLWASGDIFYTTTQSDAPYVPPAGFVEEPSPTLTPTATIAPQPTPSPTPTAVLADQGTLPPMDPSQAAWYPFTISLAAVILLLGLVIGGRQFIADRLSRRGGRRW